MNLDASVLSCPGRQYSSQEPSGIQTKMLYMHVTRKPSLLMTNH